MIKRMLLTMVFVLISNIAYTASCKDCHIPTPIKMNEVAIKKATSYLHVRETSPANTNRGPEIDVWHKYHGLGFGNPYCQMFVNFMYYEAFTASNLKTPWPKTARVCVQGKWADQHPLTIKVITTKQLNWGVTTIEPGDTITWKHGPAGNYKTYNWDGHAGLVEFADPKKKIVHTIEGNTKQGPGGDQTGRDKSTKGGLDGVYRRERSIGYNSNFPIVQFNRLQKQTYP